jgi:hypothetical protein
MAVGPKGQDGLIIRILRRLFDDIGDGGFKDEAIGHQEGFR